MRVIRNVMYAAGLYVAAILLLYPLTATTASAQLYNPPPAVDTSVMAQVQQDAAQAKATADAAMAAVPQPATSAPPGVTDTGATGTQTSVYALANHTHASKARKGRVLVPVAGFSDVTFTNPFAASPPVCAVTAETTAGDTNVVNAQIDGTPTMTGMRVRITRTAITAVSLLGLNILSVPSQVATWAHYVCLEP